MIANLVVGGLAAGCLYAMVGIAIVIVLNITDIANFKPVVRRGVAQYHDLYQPFQETLKTAQAR